MTDYEYGILYAHGFAWLIGWLCIVAFMICFCLACRVFYGPDAAESMSGRMFVLFGEILQCMVHRPLKWYGKRCIKHPQNERQKCFDVKASNMPRV